MDRLNADNAPYFQMTSPYRIEKGLNTLEGMLRGIAVDTPLPAEQLKLLWAWHEEFLDLANRHPFNELSPAVQDALDDDRLGQEEVEDLLWLIARLKPGGGCYGAVTAELQLLQGMLAGVISDGRVTNKELDAINRWADDHQHLKTVWPFAEIESLILSVQRDGTITDAEQRMLVRFFADFASCAEHRAISALVDDANVPISGLCAACPEVRFDDKLFCFTGSSTRLTRKALADLVASRGGRFSANVVQDLDYLVVGADGNPCWAFACYGRKVEKAVAYRRKGARLLLVHENDFWDAVQ